MPRMLFMLICLLAVSCSAPSSRRSKVYIPSDLDDAHYQLITLLSADEIEHIKGMTSEDGMSEYHMTLGLSIRNQWGLRRDSRLAKYFDQLGVHHADDISGIIFETFWCKLHGQPFRLDERVHACRAYWLSMDTPKEGSPRDGARLV